MKQAFFILICFLSLALTPQCFGQYNITDEYTVGCTSIKNQSRTGTCWSFATCSFLESELMRNGRGDYDLSEMYVVRNIYRDKARNYVLRQGKANFSEGSLSHDFINTVMRHGIVPESVYSGRTEGVTAHDHSELSAVLKGYLDGLIGRKSLSDKWDDGFDAILDVYLGKVEENFEVNGMKYHPKAFAMQLGLNSGDYLNLTSFTHHPFYESFILEIPDNFSNGSFINIPLDEFEMILDHAIKNGYSVAWDGDVSEKGFSAKEGLALLPAHASDLGVFDQVVEQLVVTADSRQNNFESYSTTDDHLMHIVGIAKDAQGNKFYKIKNSWGEIGDLKGFMYMSAPYFRMKTISITLHKDGIPVNMVNKLPLFN
jgi:bleomycin hydrolase